MRNAADLARAVRLVPGGAVTSTGALVEGGETFLTGGVVVADGWAAASLLCELAREDASDPEIRQVASAIRARAGSDDATARAIHAYVRRVLRFAPEPVETFQSARYSLFYAMVGDCDDHARAVLALALAAGLEARFAFLEEDGEPSHVWAQVRVGGVWVDAETTVAARFGEDPRVAARRLGIRTRGDLRGKAIVTMGDILSASALTVQDGGRVRMAVELLALNLSATSREGFAATLFGDIGFHRESMRVFGSPDVLPVDWPKEQRGIMASGLGAMVWVDAVWGDPSPRVARTTNEYTIRAASPAALGDASPVVLHTHDWSDNAFAILASFRDLSIDPESVLMLMNEESGLKAGAIGRDSHGVAFAFGISQIHDLRGVGFRGSPADYLALAPEEQMRFVKAFFAPHKRQRLDSIERIVWANFLPALLDAPGFPNALDTVLVREEGGSPAWDAAARRVPPGSFPSEAEVFRSNKGLAHGKTFITVEDLGVAARNAAHGPRFSEALARLRAAGGVTPPKRGMGLLAGLLGLVGAGGVAYVLSRG